jgi:hypothetical protein
MAILLFRLNNVPADEADEIRELLENNEIYFYETNAGMWRLGVDAIWIANKGEEEKARRLIAEYQAVRTANQQQNYAQLVEQGDQPTLWKNFCASPLRFVLLLMAIVFVLSLTFAPFAMMIKVF